MTTFRVSYPQLVAAGACWRDQAEVLHGASGTVEEADVACLAPGVRGAARSFLEQWSTAIGDLESDADDHAAALADVARLAGGTDTWVAGETAGLMPHGGGR